MQKVISILRASYPDIHVLLWEGQRLRGFFASGQEEGSLLHNHGNQGRELYRYPLVQYKVIRGIPVVQAIEDGIPALQSVILNRETLNLGGRIWSRGELQMELGDYLLGDTEEYHRYRFASPWFGLNQTNFRRYKAAGPEGRKQLLERVLTGNLLSLSKGLGLTVERRLVVDCALREAEMQFKNEDVLGFWGEFSVNFLLPELLGLGKSVSRGLGATLPLLDSEPSHG